MVAVIIDGGGFERRDFSVHPDQSVAAQQVVSTFEEVVADLPSQSEIADATASETAAAVETAAGETQAATQSDQSAVVDVQEAEADVAAGS